MGIRHRSRPATRRPIAKSAHACGEWCLRRRAPWPPREVRRRLYVARSMAAGQIHGDSLTIAHRPQPTFWYVHRVAARLGAMKSRRSTPRLVKKGSRQAVFVGRRGVLGGATTTCALCVPRRSTRFPPRASATERDSHAATERRRVAPCGRPDARFRTSRGRQRGRQRAVQRSVVSSRSANGLGSLGETAAFRTPQWRGAIPRRLGRGNKVNAQAQPRPRDLLVVFGRDLGVEVDLDAAVGTHVEVVDPVDDAVESSPGRSSTTGPTSALPPSTRRRCASSSRTPGLSVFRKRVAEEYAVAQGYL